MLSLDDWLALPPFPTESRLFVFETTQTEAQAYGAPEALLDHLIGAIEHEQRCLELEQELVRESAQLQGGQLPAPCARIQKIDEEMDKVLDLFHRDLWKVVDHSPKMSPKWEDARLLLDIAFPSGSYHITSLPYLDQLGAVDVLLEELKGSLWKRVEAFKMQHHVVQVAILAERYRLELVEFTPEELTQVQVLGAREQGQEHLVQTLAIILGAYPRSVYQDISMRACLLRPLLSEKRALFIKQQL